MAKLFLATQVKFTRFTLNAPSFRVELVGKIDGKGDDLSVFFNDADGTAQSRIIARHILGLLAKSYANPKAKGPSGLFTIAVTLDDDEEKILPPADGAAALAHSKGVEKTVKVKEVIAVKTTTVTTTEKVDPKE